MHIPKLLAVVCMAALGASSLHAQKPDTDVQSKAREKLREAMAQLDAQKGMAPAPAKVMPAPAKPAVKPPPAVVVAPSAPSKPPEVVIAPATIVPTEPKPVVKVKAEKKPVKPVVVKTENTDQWAPAKPSPEPKKKPEVSKTSVVVMPAPIIVPPITPIPGSKEQRLNELLRLYKSDKITPADYHEQRAKILAEP